MNINAYAILMQKSALKKYRYKGHRTDVQIPETCQWAPLFSFQKAGVPETGNLCESDPIQLRYLPR